MNENIYIIISFILIIKILSFISLKHIMIEIYKYIKNIKKKFISNNKFYLILKYKLNKIKLYNKYKNKITFINDLSKIRIKNKSLLKEIILEVGRKIKDNRINNRIIIKNIKKYFLLKRVYIIIKDIKNW